MSRVSENTPFTEDSAKGKAAEEQTSTRSESLSLVPY